MMGMKMNQSEYKEWNDKEKARFFAPFVMVKDAILGPNGFKCQTYAEEEGLVELLNLAHKIGQAAEKERAK